MRKSLGLAALLALAPASAHANGALAATPAAPVRNPVYAGSVAGAAAVGTMAGLPPVGAAAASFTSLTSGFTLANVMAATNAFLAMAKASVVATFNTAVSAEFFDPSTRPDVMAAVANLPMTPRQRAVPESMRGPARREDTEQEQPVPPSVDDIEAIPEGAERQAAPDARTQLTNVGGRLKDRVGSALDGELNVAFDGDGFERSPS